MTITGEEEEERRERGFNKIDRKEGNKGVHIPDVFGCDEFEDVDDVSSFFFSSLCMKMFWKTG